MERGTGRTARLAGWRAWVARLLSAVVLLASLLVPPPAESATAATLPLTVAASDRDGGAGTPSRPDGIVHAGAHCACHVADRLTPPSARRPRQLQRRGPSDPHGASPRLVRGRATRTAAAGLTEPKPP
jgi:hypothetical protein